MAATTPATTETPATTIPAVGEYIVIRADSCGGKPHIAGHRIKVQHIAVWHNRMGMSPEEIVATYTGLTLPAVYAALAYYHGHRAEVDADIAADEALADQMKAAAGSSLVEQKRAARHAAGDPLRV